MRRIALAFLFVSLVGCRPDQPTQDPQLTPAGPTSQPTVDEAPDDAAAGGPSDRPTPGAFASAPLTDWPCGAELELQDGGGVQLMLFSYSRLESCVLPGELVSRGVVGCPTAKVVNRLGDTDPLYTVYYEYDGDGRLISVVEDDGAPETFSYGQRLVHDRGVEVLTFSEATGGFTAEDAVQLRMKGAVRDGKLHSLHKNYPKIGLDIEVQLQWDGDRLTSIDSGGDRVTLDYACRDANRT